MRDGRPKILIPSVLPDLSIHNPPRLRSMALHDKHQGSRYSLRGACMQELSCIAARGKVENCAVNYARDCEAATSSPKTRSRPHAGIRRLVPNLMHDADTRKDDMCSASLLGSLPVSQQDNNR